MQYRRDTDERGFIALMTAVIVAAVLMTLALGASSAGFYARFDALGSEEKRVSLGLAESCANVALLALATSSDPIHYSVSNQIVMIGEQSCTITSITHDGASTTVRTRASFQNAFSSVVVGAHIYDTAAAPVPPGHERVEIVSWQEMW